MVSCVDWLVGAGAREWDKSDDAVKLAEEEYPPESDALKLQPEC